MIDQLLMRLTWPKLSKPCLSAIDAAASDPSGTCTANWFDQIIERRDLVLTGVPALSSSQLACTMTATKWSPNNTTLRLIVPQNSTFLGNTTVDLFPFFLFFSIIYLSRYITEQVRRFYTPLSLSLSISALSLCTGRYSFFFSLFPILKKMKKNSALSWPFYLCFVFFFTRVLLYPPLAFKRAQVESFERD